MRQGQLYFGRGRAGRAPLRPVVRAATEEDLAVVEKNREKEVYAFRVCQEKILEHKLDMSW